MLKKLKFIKILGTGLGFILVALGVSRLTAASVITACTAFGIGPASAITASASGVAEMESIRFFLVHQIPVIIPLNLILMVSYFFVNRYFDKKENTEKEVEVKEENGKEKAPDYYAIIPVLPLILLLIFSDIFSFFPTGIRLNTTTAMFISFFVALLFEWARIKSLKKLFQSMNIFWGGMGNFFKSVVTLIIAADIFSQGLISLGFIDGLVEGSRHLGFGPVGIGIVMTILIYLASMLMGSGNASFFAFGPLVPDIAARFGVQVTRMILPMSLAASMGRTVSPVAGVLIAVSDVAGVTALSIVKRNLIPLTSALIFLLIYSSI